KICWQRADITKLKVDAIVNAANNTLLGGGGVDGAIHRAAGKQLVKECKDLGGCRTGEAKITGGYNLPSKYVIHTVGPIGENGTALHACYTNSLELLYQNGLKSIAFPCISTGIYGYPNDTAAEVALSAVQTWLTQHPNAIDTVLFCLFLDVDVVIYTDLLKEFFKGMKDFEDKHKDGNEQKAKRPNMETKKSKENRADKNVSKGKVGNEQKAKKQNFEMKKSKESCDEDVPANAEVSSDSEKSDTVQEKDEGPQPKKDPAAKTGDKGKKDDEVSSVCDKGQEKGASDEMEVNDAVQENDEGPQQEKGPLIETGNKKKKETDKVQHDELMPADEAEDKV
uniref:Macro domain-containing protein n=1 Tax=Ciona intestinalis TaxID=7719 RepID=F6RJ04_CIOIN